MRRAIIIVLVLAVVAAAGYATYRYYPRETAGGALVLYGDVDVREVDLAFKVAGRVTTFPPEEGDHLAKGGVVATLDPRYFENDLHIARAKEAAQEAVVARFDHGSRPEEIAQARANAELARVAMENNEVTFKRQETLLGNEVASKQAYDNAQAAYRQSEAQLNFAEGAQRLAELGPRQEDIDQAHAQLAQEQANVAVSELDLADATLVAPADGFILTRVREPGSIVTAGETVATFALDRPVWVRAYVDEPDLGRVVPGMAADITTDSAPGKHYRGYVGFISPVAEFTPKTVETRTLRTDLVYRLRVIVDAPDQMLRQGMPVTVTLAR
ncbi:MAG TPA: efflux RND transporter periplasmic adaptor subunit [Stellaceae bacterium]|nr:efflux RND transporter periplasmic adaptor subunit [Stellaceae bacterium]